MHEQNLSSMREEAIRLLGWIDERLNAIQSDADVLGENCAGESERTLDAHKVGKNLEIVRGEKAKLENFEMVLAVVGTMKAGKSTTINAIVGCEVLPNRNRPMTALPTLIRHTPGQKQPRLLFQNSQPLQNLVDQLRIGLKHKGQGSEELAHREPELSALLKRIQEGFAIQQEYSGSQGIFDFLSMLNDMVRISRELDVEFPFADYDEIHELPVIEVEFSHLEKAQPTSGRLTLLDTPGPNESKQPQLRKMLKDQLGQASAVLAILDYSQLQSEADEDVRAMLHEVSSLDSNRLFVLVNKFDQKDRNGDTAEAVKQRVSENLLAGKVESKHVFPVSSKWGYLSNCARRELGLNGKMPEVGKEPWVTDFGSLALGGFWEEEISDAERVKKAADRLWERSLFTEPLTVVIQGAHARAAAYAMDGAAAKLLTLSGEIDRFLGTRETALTRDVQELQRLVQNIREDIEAVAANEKKSGELTQKMLQQLKGRLQKHLGEAQNGLEQELDKYFKEGKRVEIETASKKPKRVRAKEKTSAEEAPSISSFLSRFLGTTSFSSASKSPAQDFDPNQDVLVFDSQYEAEQSMNKIGVSVQNICKGMTAALQNVATDELEEFQNQFESDIIGAAKKILDGMNSRLRKDGFQLEIAMPKVQDISIASEREGWLEDIIQEKTETHTYRRRQDNLWGKFWGLFDTEDLGWEEYTESETSYRVSMKTLKKQSKDYLSQVFAGVDKSLCEKVEKPLQESLDGFFAQLRQAMESVRGDLQQSLRDHQKSELYKSELKKKLSNLRMDIGEVQRDSASLKVECLVLHGESVSA